MNIDPIKTIFDWAAANQQGQSSKISDDLITEVLK